MAAKAGIKVPIKTAMPSKKAQLIITMTAMRNIRMSVRTMERRT